MSGTESQSRTFVIGDRVMTKEEYYTWIDNASIEELRVVARSEMAPLYRQQITDARAKHGKDWCPGMLYELQMNRPWAQSLGQDSWRWFVDEMYQALKADEAQEVSPSLSV